MCSQIDDVSEIRNKPPDELRRLIIATMRQNERSWKRIAVDIYKWGRLAYTSVWWSVMAVTYYSNPLVRATARVANSKTKNRADWLAGWLAACLPACLSVCVRAPTDAPNIVVDDVDGDSSHHRHLRGARQKMQAGKQAAQRWCGALPGHRPNSTRKQTRRKTKGALYNSRRRCPPPKRSHACKLD